MIRGAGRYSTLITPTAGSLFHAEFHYSLLYAVGRDCVGALQFLPEGMDPGTAGSLEGRPLEDAEIAAMLGDLRRAPLGQK